MTGRLSDVAFRVPFQVFPAVLMLAGLLTLAGADLTVPTAALTLLGGLACRALSRPTTPVICGLSPTRAAAALTVPVLRARHSDPARADSARPRAPTRAR